jgi:hypothetical protein
MPVRHEGSFGGVRLADRAVGHWTKHGHISVFLDSFLITMKRACQKAAEKK